eukprot:360339-Chlamydomonas_euryale.AAC.15
MSFAQLHSPDVAPPSTSSFCLYKASALHQGDVRVLEHMPAGHMCSVPAHIPCYTHRCGFRTDETGQIRPRACIAITVSHLTAPHTHSGRRGVCGAVGPVSDLPQRRADAGVRNSTWVGLDRATPHLRLPHAVCSWAARPHSQLRGVPPPPLRPVVRVSLAPNLDAVGSRAPQTHTSPRART